MKVILLKDVAKIGRKSDVVEVPDGYARNQLLPKGMAKAASPGNIKKIEKQKATEAAAAEANQDRFKAALSKLKNQTVQVPAPVNEKGHAFKAISEAEIAAAITAAGIDIDPAMVKVDAPVKSVGEHEIKLQNGQETGTFQIEVVKK